MLENRTITQLIEIWKKWREANCQYTDIDSMRAELKRICGRKPFYNAADHIKIIEDAKEFNTYIHKQEELF